jgi:hypothetical protein
MAYFKGLLKQADITGNQVTQKKRPANSITKGCRGRFRINLSEFSRNKVNTSWHGIGKN